MIKINLHQRKAAVGVAAGGTSQTEVGSLKGFASIIQRLRAGQGRAAFGEAGDDARGAMILGVVYFVFALGGWWYASSEKDRLLAEVAAESSALDSKMALLDSELSKTQGYEQTKKSLEADEKKIRTKIETIQELIRDRGTPPKILMTLSDSIPKDVWLKDFVLKDRNFKISGLSNGMDVVSDFIRNLSETIYFTDVQLKGSKSEAQKSGRELTTFELEAQRR
jgi:hypothetical protein